MIDFRILCVDDILAFDTNTNKIISKKAELHKTYSSAVRFQLKLISTFIANKNQLSFLKGTAASSDVSALGVSKHEVNLERLNSPL